LDSGSRTDYVDFSSKGRSQFIDQMEAFINSMEEEAVADDVSQIMQEKDLVYEEGFTDDTTEDFELTDIRDEEVDKPQTTTVEETKEQKAVSSESESKNAELEQVMASGMQFLAGLYKMSTGKDMGHDNQQIKINKETGEVTMTFKLPM